jgi:hypothetical protein
LTRSRWLSLWLGAALSSLFFYPLVASLADSPFMLQWQPMHGLELGASFAAMTLSLGALFHLAEGLARPRLRLAALVVLCAMPAASAGMYLLRQLGAVELLNQLAQSSLGLPLAIALLAALGTAGFFAVRRPLFAVDAIRVTLLIVSPLSLLSAFQVTQQSLETVPIFVTPGEESPSSEADLPDVIVLLFDELDYDFLYDGERAILPELLNFRRLAATSDNYHRALSPGAMTLTSMPGLVTGVRGLVAEPGYGAFGFNRKSGCERERTDLPRQNLFSRAKEAGYATALEGWGMPYCEMLAPALHACRSFSVYNHSTANLQFSAFDPVVTTFTLWPFQRPFGYFKSFAGKRQQRALVEETFTRALEPLDWKAPILQLSHFSIPHDPFIYDTDRYAPPANPYLRTRDAYRRQLRYVDHLLGKLLLGIESRDRFRGAYVIVLSDHGYRAGREPATHEEIPLFVKAPFQKSRRDVWQRTHSEELLAEILRTASERK